MTQIRIYIQKVHKAQPWVDVVVTSRDRDGKLRAHLGMGTLQEGDSFTLDQVTIPRHVRVAVKRGRRENLIDELQDIQDRLAEIRMELQAKEE